MQLARFDKWFKGKRVLLRKSTINKGKTRSTAIYKSNGLDLIFIGKGNSNRNNNEVSNKLWLIYYNRARRYFQGITSLTATFARD
jgi:hypothetical protein